MSADIQGIGTVAQRVAATVERLANAHRRLVQDVATGHGLTPLQVQVLGLLSAGVPPSPRGSALARELGVAQPTVSAAIATLEGKGLVRRRPDPADRRVAVLTLTKSGAAVAGQLAAAGDTVTDVVAALPVSDREQILVSLLHLLASFAEAGVVGVARTCLTCRFHERARSSRGTDRCALLGVPLPARDLRVNCPEHEARAAG